MTSIDEIPLDFNPSYLLANQQEEQEEEDDVEELPIQDNSMIAIEFAAPALGYL